MLLRKWFQGFRSQGRDEPATGETLGVIYCEISDSKCGGIVNGRSALLHRPEKGKEITATGDSRTGMEGEICEVSRRSRSRCGSQESVTHLDVLACVVTS